MISPPFIVRPPRLYLHEIENIKINKGSEFCVAGGVPVVQTRQPG